ncbi:hypothetical protein D3C80_2045670 [compost metagenome]
MTEKTVIAAARMIAASGFIRIEAKEAMRQVRNSDGTKPRPRTVRPKNIGAGRIKNRPRQAIGPIGSPETRVA